MSRVGVTQLTTIVLIICCSVAWTRRECKRGVEDWEEFMLWGLKTEDIDIDTDMAAKNWD